jgi:hypothetical protein
MLMPLMPPMPPMPPPPMSQRPCTLSSDECLVLVCRLRIMLIIIRRRFIILS